MGERLLVCGGRDFGCVPQEFITNYVPREQFDDLLAKAARERDFGYRVLNAASRKYNIDVVIEGGALGGDRIAQTWAKEIPFIDLITEKADWKTHGKKAGILRNQAMLEDHKPTLAIAFPGGTGTADMVSRLKKAGIKVIEAKF